MSIETDDLRRYVYLKLAGCRDVPEFDPDQISRETGIAATESWRMGEPHPRRRKPMRFDYWKFESPLGSQADLSAQLSSLFSEIEASQKPFAAVVAPHEPELQYVIHTALEPVAFTVSPNVIARLVEMRAEIDCDLYWVAKQDVKESRCMSCGVPASPMLNDVVDCIGGSVVAAEMQLHMSVSGIEEAEAFERFQLDPDDYACRVDGIDVSYVNALRCLRFSSDVLPASGHIAEIRPEKQIADFAAAVGPHLESLPDQFNRELRVNFVERGGYQGSAGLHFDRAILARLETWNAPLSVRLRYAPLPSFEASGQCSYCDRIALF